MLVSTSIMSDPKMLCRLCKSTKCLTDVYEVEGDSSYLLKIKYCIDLMIYPGEGLSTMICKKCKQKVKKFYQFKQQCLKVDLEFKTVKHKSDLELTNKNNCIYRIPEIKIENEKYYEDISDEECVEKSNADIEYEPANSSGIITGNEQVSVQCEICGRMFTTKSEYKKHLSSHGEVKLFECKYCSKRFTRAETNEIHMRSHLGIRPYICEKCGQSMTKRQDLIRHMKIHSDERKHECDKCGRRFKRSSDLCSHIRTHSGARPYKCVLCGKDYTSHSGLRKHRKSHFKKEPGNTT